MRPRPICPGCPDCDPNNRENWDILITKSRKKLMLKELKTNNYYFTKYKVSNPIRKFPSSKYDLIKDL